jgi:hypothetical protein
MKMKMQMQMQLKESERQAKDWMIGGLEDYGNGGTVERVRMTSEGLGDWKIGGLEDWRIGRLED